VLRAAPFTAAALGLAAFVWLATSLLPMRVATVAGLVFAAAAPTASYAAIAKPYALDVLFAVFLAIATHRALDRQATARSIILLCASGIVAPTLSYAAVFAVAASASALVVNVIERRDRRSATHTIFVLGIWAIAYLTVYVAHRATLSHLRGSVDTAGINAASLRDAFGGIRFALGLAPSSVGPGVLIGDAATVCAALLAFIGAISIARMSRPLIALLTLPGIYALIAAAFGWYPLLVRTLLFVVPSAALLIGAGVSVFVRSSRVYVYAGAFAVCVVVSSQGVATVNAIRATTPDTGMRQALRFVAARVRSTDGIYVSYASQYPLAYYLRCGCADSHVMDALSPQLSLVSPVPGTVEQWSPALRSMSDRVIIGRFGGYNLNGYMRDAVRFQRSKRVWIVFSFLHPSERKLLLRSLDSSGIRLRTDNPDGGVEVVGVALYSFRRAD
jgi:hypothetical protein